MNLTIISNICIYYVYIYRYQYIIVRYWIYHIYIYIFISSYIYTTFISPISNFGDFPWLSPSDFLVCSKGRLLSCRSRRAQQFDANFRGIPGDFHGGSPIAGRFTMENHGKSDLEMDEFLWKSNSWMVYFENLNIWSRNGWWFRGTPISGKLQIVNFT